MLEICYSFWLKCPFDMGLGCKIDVYRHIDKLQTKPI